MSEQGFIRGGTNGGAEVDLMSILPQSMKGFSTRAKQEAIADAWERAHDVLVTRPWESPQDYARRKDAYTKRHENAGPAPERVGMSPDLAEKNLRAMKAEYRVDHPDKKRLAVLQTEIHRMEDFLGRDRTDFGQPMEAEMIDPKLIELLAKYHERDAKARKKVLSGYVKDGIPHDGIKNLPLLKLIRDSEEDESMRELAIQRIAELELM